MNASLEKFEDVTHVLVTHIDQFSSTYRLSQYEPTIYDVGTIFAVEEIEHYIAFGEGELEEQPYIVITAKRKDGSTIQLLNHEVNPVGPSWSMELPSFLTV